MNLCVARPLEAKCGGIRRIGRGNTQGHATSVPVSVMSSDYIVQGNLQVTKPILKYLLMAAIENNSTGLVNTCIAVTVQEPTQVRGRFNPLSPDRQLSVNSQRARMSFFASATSVHCRTLPGSSCLLNLPE
jgi:hypothetical protein